MALSARTWTLGTTLGRDPAIQHIPDLQHNLGGIPATRRANVAAVTHVVDSQARNQAGVANAVHLVRTSAFRQLLGKLL